MKTEYVRPTMNQWVSQKTRPTQFSSAKNAPGKYAPCLECGKVGFHTVSCQSGAKELLESVNAEIGARDVQGPVQEDSAPGPVEVSSLPDTN